MHAHALSVSLCRAHSAYIHTPHAYLVCVDRKLLSMWLVHRILAAFVVFSPTLSKTACYFFLSLFFFVLFSTAQTSQTDILIGTFGTVSILCWKDRQVSGCWGRGPGWLVCSEACLNQLAAWIARLSLTGIHWDPWHFLKQDSFFARSLG